MVALDNVLFWSIAMHTFPPLEVLQVYASHNAPTVMTCHFSTLLQIDRRHLDPFIHVLIAASNWFPELVNARQRGGRRSGEEFRSNSILG